MRAGTASARPAAVLFDRDGTLVVDVPYNGDPDLVQPVPGAREALDRLRSAGVPTALVSNQSGIARGLLTRDQVDAVNARLEELVGPLGPVFVCEHGPEDGCGCRKPAPGMVLAAADALGVDPADCVVIEDSAAGIASGLAAGVAVLGVPALQAVAPAPGLTLRDGLAGVDVAELEDVLAAGDLSESIA